MAVIRVCLEPTCRVILSQYNPTKFCWEHRRHTRRLREELEGKRVQRDDTWLLKMQRLSFDDDVRIETWRPSMMSQLFLGEDEMSEDDKAAYESGEWLG